eukprot:2668825-Amphidinium_carterae.1
MSLNSVNLSLGFILVQHTEGGADGITASTNSSTSQVHFVTELTSFDLAIKQGRRIPRWE